MIGFGLVNLHQVLLYHFQVLGIPVLEVLHFIGVLLVEFEFQVIICVQNSVHVLLCLLLRLKKRLLSSIKFILKSLHLFFKNSVFSLQESFVLAHHVDFSSQGFCSAVYFKFLILKLLKL
jgi:hypothetical protein